MPVGLTVSWKLPLQMVINPHRKCPNTKLIHILNENYLHIKYIYKHKYERPIFTFQCLGLKYKGPLFTYPKTKEMLVDSKVRHQYLIISDLNIRILYFHNLIKSNINNQNLTLYRTNAIYLSWNQVNA